MHDPLANAHNPPKRLGSESPAPPSYKFQRLREKLRHSIACGELTGKLPGERELARRFNANAKTLSKALTDLAAEGLVDRSVGRGTYVSGSQPESTTKDRWLVLCGDGSVQSSLVQRLRELNPGVQITSDDPPKLRPSFLSAFGAVIDLDGIANDDFLRDLLVRGIQVVKVGYHPIDLSTHVVALDHVMALSKLGRDLALRGHRRFATVEPQGTTEISTAFRVAASRYGSSVEVDPCFICDVALMVEHGVTAVICDCPDSAMRAAAELRQSGIAVPGEVSLAAIGCADGVADLCSGYYVNVNQQAAAIAGLLRDRPLRPTPLWLVPHMFDGGTIGEAGQRAVETPVRPILASA